MKKTLILIVFMLINLITPAYADQAAQVKQRVEFIYNTVFAAYNKAAKTEYSLISIPDFDSKFCSQDLKKNLSRIDKIQEKKIQEGEYPIIDANYWIQAQDFVDNLHFKDLKVVEVSGNKATVNMIIKSYEDIPITLKLVFERGDWYIDNFISRGWDLHEGIKEAIKEYSKSK